MEKDEKKYPFLGFWLPQIILPTAVLVVMILTLYFEARDREPSHPAASQAQVETTPALKTNADGTQQIAQHRWPDLSPYWPIGLMVMLIAINTTVAVRHKRRVRDSEGALSMAVTKIKELHTDAAAIKPYPKVEIWRHSASTVEQADKVKNLFKDCGWEVDDSHTTNLPQHASGVTLCGGTSFNRNAAAWGLQTLKLKSEIEHRNDPPKDLQVIIGAFDPNQSQTVGEWAVLDMANQRDAALQALSSCQKNFALARLRWVAERAEESKTEVEVQIRFAEYQDYDLAKKLEELFKQNASKWAVEIDGTNKPVLKPAGDFKVIFDCGFMQSYAEVASAFSDGDLAGATIGMRRSDRFSNGPKPPALIIEVLPTVKRG